jgi:hypothetical protein
VLLAGLAAGLCGGLLLRLLRRARSTFGLRSVYSGAAYSATARERSPADGFVNVK